MSNKPGDRELATVCESRAYPDMRTADLKRIAEIEPAKPRFKVEIDDLNALREIILEDDPPDDSGLGQVEGRKFDSVSSSPSHRRTIIRRTMKPTNGITLPASFIVTVSLAGTEIAQVAPPDNDILTVAEVAEVLKCKPSSIYNLTCNRGRARYDNPIPVLRLPMGLRFRRSSVLAWLKAQETTRAA